MMGVTGKGHILVVDDEDAIRFMLENQLFKEGYKVSIAANGLHAMNKIKSDQKYDLIICDLKMPGMAGLEFLTAIRKLGIETPFLIITGFPDKKKIMSAVEQGIGGVMLKPFSNTELIAKIASLLTATNSDQTPMAA